MMTRPSTHHIALVACLALGALEAASAQQTVFRASTDLVVVDVAVSANRQPVAGLTTADFELTDRGVPQTIDVTLVEQGPIDVTLLLDVSGSVEGPLLERLKTSVRDTARLLRPDDRLRVIAVQHILHEVVPMASAAQAPVIDALKADGGTALYDGLAAAMMRTSSPGRRQLVVAYTDGGDASSITSEERALAVSLQADAVVHLVVPVENARDVQIRQSGPMRRFGAAAPSSGPPTVSGGATLDLRPMAAASSNEVFTGESTLRELTARTGGQVFIVDLKDSISEAFKRALDEYRTSYVLRYVAQGVERAGWHDIVVRVKKHDYQVRARKGYSGG
jgi:VWFA-related protein